MQFLMLIKIANNPDYEAGKPVPPELEAAMGKLIGEWTEAGAFVSAAGLKPTSKGARLRLNAGKIDQIDGPFAETKEVVGGFFILEAKSRATVVKMTRRFLEVHRRILGNDFQLECELRQLDA